MTATGFDQRVMEIPVRATWRRSRRTFGNNGKSPSTNGGGKQDAVMPPAIIQDALSMTASVGGGYEGVPQKRANEGCGVGVGRRRGSEAAEWIFLHTAVGGGRRRGGGGR